MIPAIQETRFIRLTQASGLYSNPKKRGMIGLSAGGLSSSTMEKRRIKNLITITGGKLMTYRLMAEKTSDLICEKMGRGLPCSTHLKPLPGVNRPTSLKERLKQFSTEQGKPSAIVSSFQEKRSKRS